ncbi:methyl-accepting chemotaxis protein [Geobacter sp. SVR]|uniref:methyl-accepting chemotaxis protein n=1 Tax=Geobacter sp. SVR TaxID=2495594 RepID=UPI00143EFBE8|nr:methyl-accepting chemotaxis protein [Geobacter sp. SVR]BCS52851.1 methyl-accepting chemotaxis protein [Geobacter sp. SVR]GCF86718.1 hypothetical protein GSbR_33180 [Geobacter sp. SVR]
MFKSRSLGMRLGIGFGMVLALLLAANLYALSRMNNLAEITATLYNHPFTVNDQLGVAQSCILKMQRSMKDVALAKNPGEVEKAAGLAEKYEADALKALDKVKERYLGDKKMVEQVAVLLAEWKPVRNEVISLMQAGRYEQAAEVTKEKGAAKVGAIQGAIDALSDTVSARAVAFMEDARTVKKHTLTVMLCITLLALLAGSAFAFIITRGILGQVGGEPEHIAEIAERIAVGDLTVRFQDGATAETGVYASMRKMVVYLRDITTQLGDISAGIAAASQQLHSTAAQIATGAEEVAAQTNTVATASEEMSATSSDIARNCTMAAEASQKSTDAATAGARVVQETISGMGVIADRVRQTSRTVEALGSRSEQIGAIVGTIEDIADQTNLLALNAAIEAARAGEQGRGFAVVADEVRALAERTTKATQEIGEMIKAIQSETRAAVRAMDEGVQEVEKGALSSQKSGQALEEILDRISEVSLQVSQIATAAEQQTATTGEVTGNIQQVTEVVHQTARGADETAGAAAQLADQAQSLQNLVSRFRLS